MFKKKIPKSFCFEELINKKIPLYEIDIDILDDEMFQKMLQESVLDKELAFISIPRHGDNLLLAHKTNENKLLAFEYNFYPLESLHYARDIMALQIINNIRLEADAVTELIHFVRQEVKNDQVSNV